MLWTWIRINLIPPKWLTLHHLILLVADLSSVPKIKKVISRGEGRKWRIERRNENMCKENHSLVH